MGGLRRLALFIPATEYDSLLGPEFERRDLSATALATGGCRPNPATIFLRRLPAAGPSWCRHKSHVGGYGCVAPAVGFVMEGDAGDPSLAGTREWDWSSHGFSR
jgi:hypothetical protein